MVESPRHGARRARLVLGTAGLGMAYGLPPKGHVTAELIAEDDALAILRGALDAGIGAFDTAPAYGEAERRLGAAIGDAGCVWTKLLTEDDNSVFERSLRSLHRTHIELLQWHNWTKSLLDDSRCARRIEHLRHHPHIGELGATTYGVDHALAAVESGWFGVVQVEWNLLNQQVVEAVGEAANRHGVRIAVRSVLLQGVLTERGETLPHRLAGLGPARARAAGLAQRYGVRLDEFAIRAALDHPAIAYVLVGIDRHEQLATALAAADADPLPAPSRSALRTLHSADAPTDPRHWTHA